MSRSERTTAPVVRWLAGVHAHLGDLRAWLKYFTGEELVTLEGQGRVPPVARSSVSDSLQQSDGTGLAVTSDDPQKRDGPA